MKPKAKKRKVPVKSKKKKVVFTNGIFDIVHIGHLNILRFAKSLGDKLVVGINSDRATKALKGEERPINNELYRKAFLEALGFIDEVVIFNEERTGEVVRRVEPHIVVKGSEYSVDEVRQKDNIPEHIDIVIFPVTHNPDTPNEKYSSTHIIHKLRGKK